MKKVCFIAGTRPEIIKIAPVLKKFLTDGDGFFSTVLCTTGQHKDMAEQALQIFDLKSDYDLQIMSVNQTLNSISSKIFERLPEYFELIKPDIVFVQGDTTTAAIAGLVAFNMRIPVAHIEAGLRTYNLDSPFPEELNRRIISNFSRFNFVPTSNGKDALLKENCDPSSIIITGNTVVDALEFIKRNNDFEKIFDQKYKSDKPFILLTAHRRESFGKGFENICEAISKAAIKYPDINFFYPVHMNPNVRLSVSKYLSDIDNVILTEPLSYIELLAFISKSLFCVTDSGGIQEEAPSFGKYTIVLREFTERMESVNIGISELVGTDVGKISKAIDTQVNNCRSNITRLVPNPFGNGDASEIIFKTIRKHFYND